MSRHPRQHRRGRIEAGRGGRGCQGAGGSPTATPPWPIGRPVVDEVPAPDAVAVRRPPPGTAVGARPQPSLLPLPPRDFQPLPPPEAVDPLAVDPPARRPPERPDAAVAVARVPPGQR